jgi:hypothetical protein
MSRSLLIVPASLLCLFGLLGCEEGGADPNAPASTAAPAAVVINDDDLAVPADFEDEAEKSITVASYKAELQTLETEIQ